MTDTVHDRTLIDGRAVKLRVDSSNSVPAAVRLANPHYFVLRHKIKANRAFL